MGKKTLIIYLLAIAVSSLICGIGLDMALLNFTLPPMKHLHEMGDSLIKTISGIILAGIFAYAVFKRYFIKNTHIAHSHTEHNKGLQEFSIVVKGMTCNHCSSTVKRTLLEINGIENVEVDLNSGNVYVEGNNIDMQKIKSEIEKVGYTVE
jgi:copper chaperone CopZ